MLRRLPLIVGLAVALALGAVGPAWASQPYLLNFNHVNFVQGTAEGVASAGTR